MIMVARAKDPTPPEKVSFRRRCDWWTTGDGRWATGDG